MAEDRAIAPRAPMAMGSKGLRIESLEELWRLAQNVSKTDFAPKGWSAEQCMIAMTYGMEVGLSPLQGLQQVAVINGKPSLYGDAPLALCRAHPDWDGSVFQEGVRGQGDAMEGYCVVGRRGEEPKTQTFSVADAKKAGLWGKQGPWTSYPQRMLQLAARRWAIRDKYGDVLKGLVSDDEAGDIQPMRSSYLSPVSEPAPEIKPYAPPASAVEAQPEKPKRAKKAPVEPAPAPLEEPKDELPPAQDPGLAPTARTLSELKDDWFDLVAERTRDELAALMAHLSTLGLTKPTSTSTAESLGAAVAAARAFIAGGAQ